MGVGTCAVGARSSGWEYLSTSRVIIAGGNRAPRRAGGHREINFFNVMLPVRSLMTEIYMCAGKSQFPLEGLKGKARAI